MAVWTLLFIIINIRKIQEKKIKNSTPKMEFLPKVKKTFVFLLVISFLKLGFALGQLEQKLWQFERYFPWNFPIFYQINEIKLFFYWNLYSKWRKYLFSICYKLSKTCFIFYLDLLEPKLWLFERCLVYFIPRKATVNNPNHSDCQRLWNKRVY
mgnify:CR=1 FL=1